MAKPPSSESILGIDLPEIPDRDPYSRPTSHLLKNGENDWQIVQGRRQSKTLMVNRLREAVDTWRAEGYTGASDTSRRLLQFWFEDDHHLPWGEPFRYYFCQREAVETLVYLHEVRGHRDVFKLISEFYEEPEGSQLELGITTRGARKIRRFVPELGQVVEQDLPREWLPRMAIKMATGSGKTVVMALVIAWSYFHRRFEKDSELADNFLIVAPNVIVFERLRQDFESGKVFHDLPMLPPEWQAEWQLNVILRGEAALPKKSGNLFVTNIQQIYDREEVDEGPINPVAALLGPAPKGNIQASEPMLDRIKRVPNLMVLNDEAHHVYDDTLKWNETLLMLDAHLRERDGRGLVAWLDLSATPKNQKNGTFFPWIIVDYPLAQAVEDRIVKTPLIIHQTDRPDPDKYAHEDAGDAYNEWISIAVARWREHRKDYGAVGEKPILFVMAETTKDADSIADRLERESDLKGRVLTIHINEGGKDKGEISKQDLDLAREAAREIDSGRSRYRAVVSVLMLREGWDVRNVSVILGLRPFTAKANILPEQAIGRGLRLMRKIPRGNTQILELIGTQAFGNFVRELEKEGLGIATTKTPPKPGVKVYPVAEKVKYDIEIPRTTALFERAYKNIEKLDPAAFGPLATEEDLDKDLSRLIQLEHGTVGVTVHSDEVEFNDDNVPAIENLLSSLTKRVMHKARITTGFPTLFPKVREYVRERCFGHKVELEEVGVRRALNNGALLESIARVFARRIGELTTEQRSVEVVGEPYRLSDTPEFTWRRQSVVADRTIFNVVACYNNFEARFAQFLDRANDVDRFAELAEWFTGFHVQYLKSSGAVGTYYPDFVVVQTTAEGPVNWIIETKGREDVEVAAKDAQMERWCNEVTAVSGKTWRYMKVPQVIFDRGGFSTLASLVREVERASAAEGAPRLAFGPGVEAAG